jgi:DNA-binding NarL/FixJ family response regulator
VAKVRILIVDDQTLFREGLASVLNADPHFDVVGHCASVQAALHILSEAELDVVLLDSALGQQSLFDFFNQAERVGFRGRVLIVTAGLSKREGLELIRLGACGIVKKHSSAMALPDSILQVVSGKMWIEQQDLRAFLEEVAVGHISQAEVRQFTKLEREVLICISNGLTNNQIATRLGKTETSIKSTVQQLFKKTGFRKRSQLVHIALELNRNGSNLKC